MVCKLLVLLFFIFLQSAMDEGDNDDFGPRGNKEATSSALVFSDLHFKNYSVISC